MHFNPSQHLVDNDEWRTKISKAFLERVNQPMPVIDIKNWFKVDQFPSLKIGSLQVYNLESKKESFQFLNAEDHEKVMGLLKSAETVGILGATLRPVRTNTLKNFAKDFFLPTTVNQALRVKPLAKRVFAVLAALVLDTLTFPIRLLTCIPTILTNTKPEDHPFYQYLKTDPATQHVLHAEHVRVQWEFDGKDDELMLNFFKQPRFAGCDLGQQVIFNEFDELRNAILRKIHAT